MVLNILIQVATIAFEQLAFGSHSSSMWHTKSLVRKHNALQISFILNAINKLIAKHFSHKTIFTKNKYRTIIKKTNKQKNNLNNACL